MTTTQRYSTSLSYKPENPERRDHQDSHSTTDKMNPSSELLQDLLREKKASQHARRMSQQSGYAASERQIQSSPIGPPGPRQVSNASNRRTSGYTAPKEMGLREMEEYISKINKQNFDLKLEIFHRRQRSEALEAKAEKAEELQIQNDELRQINDDLLLELEKRDVAVEEAVALICDLEARIGQLETDKADHAMSPTVAVDKSDAQMPEPPVTPSPPHGTFRSPASSPNGGQQKQPGISLLRSPSFLRDDHPSTSALRGLFIKDGVSTNRMAMAEPSIRSLRRAGSVLSQDDDHETVDGDPFSLNPRRLSLLSESSFVSVYGREKDKITPSSAHRRVTSAPPTHEDDMPFTRSLSPQEGRIRSWIENKDHPASPSKTSVISIRPEKFSSIGELLEPNEPIPREVRSAVSPTPSKKHRPHVQSQEPSRTNIKPSFGGPIFGPDVLPPTPGTMSTATLGGRSSNHSILAERSLGGTPQRSNGSTAVPDQSYEGTYATRSFRNEAAGVSQGVDGDDTDIEISDDEGHAMAAAPSLRDAFNYPNDSPHSMTTQRPAFPTHTTNLRSNGEGLGATPPARTISYHSPSRSQQSASQVSTKSTEKASTSSKNGSQISDRHPSTQKALTAEPSNPSRPLPSRSQSSRIPSQPPGQTLTSRLFRRNLPAARPESTPPAPAPEANKPRPPRPSSLYQRSNTTQPPSSAGLRISRSPRPGTAGSPAPPPINTRRHSVNLDSILDDSLAAGGEGFLDQQKQGQQQSNKRLSVGAIGRSASLKIKEGFGRKK